MSLTPSQSIQLGSVAPDFSLLDTVSNSTKDLQSLQGKNGTLIMFICNHCPFVIHINKTISALAKTYQDKGIQFIAISSNDVNNYPQDAPELMAQTAIKEDYTYPYLYDETQEIAQAYGAECTPDIYLYDSDLKLFYHGQLDDSRPGNNVNCDGKDLVNAFEELLKGNNPPLTQKPSIGCNIKWK